MPSAYYLKNRDRVADLAINALTAAGTATLTEAGEYTVYCKENVDCFIRTGASANNAMATNSQRVLGGKMIEIIVESGDKIWGMVAIGTATLEICKVRSNIYY